MNIEEYLKGMRFMLSELQIEVSGCKDRNIGSSSCGRCAICIEGNKVLKNTEKRLNDL